MKKRVLKELLDDIAKGKDLISLVGVQGRSPALVWRALQKLVNMGGSPLFVKTAERHRVDSAYLVHRIQGLLRQVEDLKREAPYTLLGVRHTATPAEIHQRWKALMKEWHPDKRGGDPQAQEYSRKINEAYEFLKDHEKRKEYDKMYAPLLAFLEAVEDGEADSLTRDRLKRFSLQLRRFSQSMFLVLVLFVSKTVCWCKGVFSFLTSRRVVGILKRTGITFLWMYRAFWGLVGAVCTFLSARMMALGLSAALALLVLIFLLFPGKTPDHSHVQGSKVSHRPLVKIPEGNNVAEPLSASVPAGIPHTGHSRGSSVLVAENDLELGKAQIMPRTKKDVGVPYSTKVSEQAAKETQVAKALKNEESGGSKPLSPEIKVAQKKQTAKIAVRREAEANILPTSGRKTQLVSIKTVGIEKHKTHSKKHLVSSDLVSPQSSNRAVSVSRTAPVKKQPVTEPVAAPSQSLEMVDRFIEAYQKGNISLFFSLFSSDATENGRPVKDYFPRYRVFFQSFHVASYRLLDREVLVRRDSVEVKGHYLLAIVPRSGGNIHWIRGSVAWLLAPDEKNRWLIERLNYTLQ